MRERLQHPAFFFALVTLCHCGQTSAATFWVTNNADTGPGTLRAAILDANAALGGKILFSNISGTIDLISALPAIVASTELRGPGLDRLTLSGNRANRVLAFNAGTTNILAGLTIANGWTTNSAHGAGIFNAG